MFNDGNKARYKKCLEANKMEQLNKGVKLDVKATDAKTSHETMAQSFRAFVGNKNWQGSIMDLAKQVAAITKKGNEVKAFNEINNNYAHGNGGIKWNESYKFETVSGKGKEKVVKIVYVAPTPAQ